MSKGSLVNIDTTGLRRIAQRVANTSKRAEVVRKRALVTLSRRLKAETARQVSDLQLNLSARQVSPYINVKIGSADGMDYISVTASNVRLPIKAFKPRIVPKHGLVVLFWRGEAPSEMPHAFRLNGDWWERVPYRSGLGALPTPSGLVDRLPITRRVGPSLKRALQPVGRWPTAPHRDEIVEYLKEFGMDVLRAELTRLAEIA